MKLPDIIFTTVVPFNYIINVIHRQQFQCPHFKFQFSACTCKVHYLQENFDSNLHSLTLFNNTIQSWQVLRAVLDLDQVFLATGTFSNLLLFKTEWKTLSVYIYRVI